MAWYLFYGKQMMTPAGNNVCSLIQICLICRQQKSKGKRGKTISCHKVSERCMLIGLLRFKNRSDEDWLQVKSWMLRVWKWVAHIIESLSIHSTTLHLYVCTVCASSSFLWVCSSVKVTHLAFVRAFCTKPPITRKTEMRKDITDLKKEERTSFAPSLQAE